MSLRQIPDLVAYSRDLRPDTAPYRPTFEAIRRNLRLDPGVSNQAAKGGRIRLGGL